MAFNVCIRLSLNEFDHMVPIQILWMWIIIICEAADSHYLLVLVILITVGKIGLSTKFIKFEVCTSYLHNESPLETHCELQRSALQLYSDTVLK